jgi:ketosteroid isomerase-like protein
MSFPCHYFWCMKKKIAVLLFHAFLCIHTNCLFAQPAIKADATAIAHLNKFRSDYVKGMTEGKPELIHSYYANDMRFLVEFHKTIMRKENALLYLKAFLSRFNIRSYTRSEIEILDIGEMVLEFGTYEMKIESKRLNRMHDLKGNYMNIWKKSGNNQLTLITDGWNYNHQVDIGDQLGFDEVPSVDVAHMAHVPINNNISFELAALNSLKESAITEHDAKIWARFYTDDAIIFSRRHGVYKGRKAIDEYLESHIKELPVFEKLDLRTDRIDDVGQYVIEYATNLAVWRVGDYSGVGTGKDVRIWRREPGGPLKIFRQIGMYD